MNESLITHLIYALLIVLLLAINYFISSAHADSCNDKGCPISVPAYDPENPPGNPYSTEKDNK